MTEYLSSKPFPVGSKSSKVCVPCTEAFHSWPVRDGKGGYKCWFCHARCERGGKSIEAVKK